MTYAFVIKTFSTAAGEMFLIPPTHFSVYARTFVNTYLITEAHINKVTYIAFSDLKYVSADFYFYWVKFILEYAKEETNMKLIISPLAPNLIKKICDFIRFI